MQQIESVSTNFHNDISHKCKMGCCQKSFSAHYPPLYPIPITLMTTTIFACYRLSPAQYRRVQHTTGTITTNQRNYEPVAEGHKQNNLKI